MLRTLEQIHNGLSSEDKELFHGKSILITGYRGFIGSVLCSYFIQYNFDLGLNKLILLDNSSSKHSFTADLDSKIIDINVSVYSFDVIKDDYDSIPYLRDVDFVFHLASIASPSYYRKYPLETMDANVIGLRRLLDYLKIQSGIKFLHFSTSEVYGDPSSDSIPTSEDYNGNVSPIGPRSCYDESKRYSETICYYYNQIYYVDITVVRPFNNYGPGLNLHDKRAPADFANSIHLNEDIVLLSDGSPTRSYLFISDAIIGYIKAIHFDGFEIFNIGNDSEEISIREFALKFVDAGEKLFNYNKNLRFESSIDENYLVNNPQRRMPNIDKAREKLNFSPKINLSDGIEHYLLWTKDRMK